MPDKVFIVISKYYTTLWEQSHLNEPDLKIPSSPGGVSTIQQYTQEYIYSIGEHGSGMMLPGLASQYSIKRTLTQRGSRMMLPGGSRP